MPTLKLPTYFTLVLFAMSLVCYAQATTLDSLKIELSQHTGQDSLRVKLLIAISSELTHSDPKMGVEYIDQALSLSQKDRYPRGEALSLRQKGNLYYVMADNLNALDFFQKALTLSLQLEDRDLESTLLNNIANIHADLKEYDKALEKYEAFLVSARTTGQIANQIKGLSNIAIVHTDLKDYEKGLSYLKKALELAQQEDNLFYQAAIINNLALAYKRMGAYKESLANYEKAMGIAKRIDNSYIEASALNSIGKVHILLENYGQARIAGENALRLSNTIGAVEWQADAYEVLSTVYKEQGEAEKALNAFKKHIIFRDSVLNEEKRSEFTRKEMQFEMEKQQTAALLEIDRQQLIKNGYLAGTVVVVLMAILGYVLYKRHRDTLEKQKLLDFRAKVAETELKALRSQMNPHFIFNSLNSISDFIAKNQPEQANRYLVKFAKLTRTILENSEKNYISILEDLELIELYMQLEALRLRNKFTYTIKVDTTIDQENMMVPPLMMQPFIENSIWHGLSKKPENGHIHIEIIKNGDMVKCVIEDNGLGRSKTVSMAGKKTSMGTKITRNRLDILNSLKQSKGTMNLMDGDEGFRVELTLPYELQF